MVNVPGPGQVLMTEYRTAASRATYREAASRHWAAVDAAAELEAAAASGPAPPSPRPPEDPRHPILEIVCVGCGEPTRPVMISCGDRTCSLCRGKWYGQHYKAVLDFVSGFKDVRFLTLTEKNIKDGDFRKEHVVQLRGWFGELRKKFPGIRGGVYVVQATNGGKGWHPHLHILFDGSYVLEDDLRRAWREITKGSFEVKIERVTDLDKAVGYLLSDFLQAPKIRPEDVDVYNEVFKGSRLLQTFGSYKNWKFRIARAPFKCPFCGCDKSTTRERYDLAVACRAVDARLRSLESSGDHSPTLSSSLVALPFEG